MRLFVLACLFFTSPALALDPTISDYRSHVDQARFFIKKGWLEDAYTELMAAVSDPNGKLDAEIWYLLSLLELQRCDLVAARRAISTAQTHARDEEQLQQVIALQQEMSSGYGWLTLPKSYPKKAVSIQSISPIFETSAKEFYHRVQIRARESKSLPLSVALPSGMYEIDGTSVTVSENETVPSAPPKTTKNKPIKAYVFTGIGTGSWFSQDSPHLGSYGLVEGALGLQRTPFIAEFGARWTPQSFTQADGANNVQWDAFDISIRAGIQGERGKYAIQWLIGTRAVRLQPLELFCTTENNIDTGCALRDGDAAFIYPKVWAFGLFTSIRLERTISLGALGVALAPEYALGRAPASGTARFVAESSEIQYVVESQSRSWRSFGGSVRLYVRWDLK